MVAPTLLLNCSLSDFVHSVKAPLMLMIVVDRGDTEVSRAS